MNKVEYLYKHSDGSLSNFSRTNIHLFKETLLNPKIYIRFNGFKLNNIPEIQKFLMFNGKSINKTIRNVTNCYKSEIDTSRTPRLNLDSSININSL